MSALHLIALVAFLPLAAGATIPADQLKAGVEIVVDLPELGNATRLEGAGPVQMGVFLPRNWRKDCAHPVIVHLGGGAGGRDTGEWRQVTRELDFILLAIDYTAPVPRDPGFKNAAFGLEVLAKATAIDRKAVVVAGASSGAYNITDSYASPNGKLFAGFCVIIGGMTMDAAAVAGRPVLLVAGEKDTDNASAGRPRVDAQRDCYQALKRGGANVQLLMQPGVGHAWTAEHHAPVNAWLHRTTPCLALRRAQMIGRLAARTTLQRRVAFYREALAESPFAPAP